MATVKKKKTGTQLSLVFKAKKKRKKPTKSVKKITNKGLLRARITTQQKKISTLKKQVAAEKKKETALKKKLAKVRTIAKPRKRTAKKKA